MTHSTQDYILEISKRLLVLFSIPLFTIYTKIVGGSTKHTVWLVGENRGAIVKDNAYHFFKYCRKERSHENIYFVAQKKYINQDDFLYNDPNVLIFGSFKHCFYFVLSTTCFYTHEYRDILYRRAFQLFGARKKLVYLHHGVLGLKKLNSSYVRNKNAMDLFTIAFEHENSILVDAVGVDAHRICKTGYARYNGFTDKSDPENIEICYFPTSRSWIKLGSNDRSFADGIGSLLNSSLLQELLKRNEAVFTVCLHVIDKDDHATLRSLPERVRLADKSESARTIMQRANLMISDYSSVSWDFFVLNKPVIFYRFDLEQYLDNRGSYIDLKEEVIGEITYTEEDLLDVLEKYFINDFNIDQKFVYSSVLKKAVVAGDICGSIYSEASRLEQNSQISNRAS